MSTTLQRSGYVLVFLLVLAVVPTAALVYMQYRSLTQLQDQMHQAMAGTLQQAVIGARVEAENDFYRWPHRALLGVEIHDWLRQRDVVRMQEVALATRRICPQVSMLFGYLVLPGRKPEVFIFRPGTARRSMTLSSADPAEQGVRDLAGAVEITNAHFYSAFDNLDGERQQIFFHLVDDDPVEPKQLPHRGFLGFYGFAVPEKRLAAEYFAPLLEKHLARVATASSGIPITKAFGGIFDESGRQLGATSPAASANFTVTEGLDSNRGILPGWTIRAGFPSSALISFDRRHFVGSIALVLVIAGMLAGTIIVLGMATARQKELSRAKTEFVATVSHELKTPLSLIRGFVETLQLNRVGAPAQREEYYGIIQDEIGRLSTMIDRILDMSKIEVGLKQYQPQPVDLPRLIESALAHFSHELERGGFTLECRIEANLPVADIDPQAFSQALWNLLSNAIKYSGADRRIVVAASQQNGQVEVSVQDHGIGIPKREQGRIFERFYRVRHAASRASGAGLGLALVKHFADAHGGDIRVTSAPGKGSRFAILLPLRA